MKYVGIKMWLAVLLVAVAFAGRAAAQAPAGGVTREETAEAHAAAAAFAERLRATQDFAAVARELYADDFMSRQLKGISDWSKGAGAKNFMLEGIPSLTFERSLAAKAPVEDWKRVRLAADNLLYFVWLSTVSNYSLGELSDPDKMDERAIFGVFPAEAVGALNANPALASFLKNQVGEVVIRTPEELRAVAVALEEAVRLTRPRLAESLAKGRHLDANLRLFGETFSREEVKLAEGEATVAGYAEGTRLFRVYAPNAYSLRLVKQGGAMKIAWAGLPHD